MCQCFRKPFSSTLCNGNHLNESIITQPRAGQSRCCTQKSRVSHFLHRLPNRKDKSSIGKRHSNVGIVLLCKKGSHVRPGVSGEPVTKRLVPEMFFFTVQTALGLPGNSDTAISVTYLKSYTYLMQLNIWHYF